MKGNVSAVQADTSNERPLSPRVLEALGELVGVAQKGLVALSVGIGLGVLTELMEEEATEVVGPKGRHDPERRTVRHGHEAGEVTLGARRVGVERPRVRAADGAGEVGFAVYRHFADRDPLSRVVCSSGCSPGSRASATGALGSRLVSRSRLMRSRFSKSAISRTFTRRTRQALRELMARRLDDVRLAVLMLDGINRKGRTNVVAFRDHLGRGEDPARALRRARPITPP